MEVRPFRDLRGAPQSEQVLSSLAVGNMNVPATTTQNRAAHSSPASWDFRFVTCLSVQERPGRTPRWLLGFSPTSPRPLELACSLHCLRLLELRPLGPSWRSGCTRVGSCGWKGPQAESPGSCRAPSHPMWGDSRPCLPASPFQTPL